MKGDVMSTQSLKGKKAMVIGGSRDIGAAVVKRLAREGAAVAFTYPLTLASGCRAGCQSIGISTSVKLPGVAAFTAAQTSAT